MTKQETDFIGSMNMCDEISNEAYKKIMCHCEVEEQYPNDDCISRKAVKEMLTEEWTKYMPMESDVNLSFVLEKISELPSVTPKCDSIPREKLETAKKMIKARFMDSGETVMQNETRRAVCREFIEILEEICG